MPGTNAFIWIYQPPVLLSDAVWVCVSRQKEHEATTDPVKLLQIYVWNSGPKPKNHWIHQSKSDQTALLEYYKITGTWRYVFLSLIPCIGNYIFYN